jgi:nicotinamidase-related amidase
VIDELAPEAGEYLVEKYCYGAFHGTELLQTLQFLAVETLVVTGTVTQICVEETGRQAFHYGYPTTMVSDAVSSFDAELHAATLKNFAGKFGWVASSEDVIGRLA